MNAASALPVITIQSTAMASRRVFRPVALDCGSVYFTVSAMPTEAVDAATLPFFSQPPCCERCGGRGEIRVHFDRDCELVRGDHFHRICPCGYRWVEQCRERPAEQQRS